MKLTFTLTPDGTASLEIDADNADVRQLTELGINNWAWMTQRMIGGGAQDYDPNLGGVQEAAQPGLERAQEDAVHP